MFNQSFIPEILFQITSDFFCMKIYDNFRTSEVKFD